MPKPPTTSDIESTPTANTDDIGAIEVTGAESGSESKAAAPASAAAVEFASRYLGATAPSKKKKDEGDGKKKPAAGPPKKSTPKPAPAPAPAPPGIDEEKLGRALGEGVVKAMEAKRESSAAKSEVKLDPSEDRKIKVLQQMEASWPDRYKGISTTFATSMEDLRAYAKKWEQDHPGKKFDQDDEEHAEFISALESKLEYDEDDYIDALADLKIKGKGAPAPDPKTEELNQRLSRFERSEKIRELQPELAKSGAEAGNEFWRLLTLKTEDKILEGVVGEGGAINMEVLQSIQSSDPDRFQAMVSAATNVESLSGLTALLDRGLVDFDAANPAHKFLSDFAMKSEERMVERDPEKQLNAEGLPFVSREKWVKLTAEERGRVWTFSAQDLNRLLAADYAKNVAAVLKSEEEKFQRRAKLKGLITEEPPPRRMSGNPAFLRPRTPLSRPVEEPAEGNEKPLSPTLQSVPRVAPRTAARLEGAKTGIAAFAQRAIHGR